jgi:HlyD family secretion protein
MRRLGSAAVVAAVIALAAGAYFYWWRNGGATRDTFVTEAVSRGPVAVVVTATGTVNPVTTVQVGTYVSGPIRAIDVDYNSPVKKGQRVAKIDPAPFLVKVQQAEANLATARARVDKDRADVVLKALTLKRNRELRTDNLISQNDLDTADSNYKQALAQQALDEATVKQMQAALEEARINLAYTDITSPVDGVVVSRNVDVGQTVAASFQTPTLFLIAQDLTKMQVNANVSESDIGQVAAGQSATFTVDAYPDKTFAGSVAQVRNAPITVQNVVTYDVVIAVDNPDLELKPGMTASVTILTAHREDVLRVPIRALRFNPKEARGSSQPTPARPTREEHNAPAVWVLQRDGTVRRVEVRLGLRNDQFAELLSDTLAAGDQLAVAFQRRSQRASGPSIPGVPRFRH